MKNRSGFVSNSSSSSFILAIPKENSKQVCPTCGKSQTVTIEEIKRKLDRSSYEETAWDYHPTREDEAMENLESFMWIDKDEENPWEQDIKEYIKDHDILMGSVSYHDDYSSDLWDYKDIHFIYRGD